MPILDSNLYEFTRTAWALLATCAGMLILGLSVMIRESYSRAGRAFFLMMPPAVVWFGSFAFLHSSFDPDNALFWSRTAYLGVPFIPAVITNFSVTVLGLRRPGLIAALFLVSACFSFGFLTSHHFIESIQRFSWGFYPRYGVGGAAFVLYFAGALAYNVGLFWQGLREAKAPRSMARYRAFLTAFSLTFLGATDFLAKFGFDVYPFGFLVIFAFLLIMAWANWRYRLVDITPAFAAAEILETLQSAVVVTDFYGIVRVMNSAAVRLFGRPADELVGHTLPARGLRIGPRGAVERPAVPYRGFESVLRRPDGREVELDLSATWLTGNAGTRIGIVYVADDVSQKVREAAELARSTAEKEQLELFASIAAHDLKAPLNHIGSFADLAATAIADRRAEAAQGYLGRIRASALRVQQMIDGLLRYERAVIGEGREEQVELSRLIEDVRSALPAELDAARAVVIGRLPVVRGLPFQLRQLFENLITNSAKFRHPDRPLRIDVEATPEEGGVRVVVRDNGIGFRKEDAERVFVPFARLDSAARLEGHGLGLAICRRVVTKHGGRIEAVSEPGVGTMFVIHLPAERCIAWPADSRSPK